MYQYQPVKFFSIVSILTWFFWIIAAIMQNRGYQGAALAFMMLGLFLPAATAIVMVIRSKNEELKKDFREKFYSLKRIRISVVLLAILVYGLIVAGGILLSTIFGQSLDQFSFVEGFSFSVGAMPTFLLLITASVIEEVGWRGYALDSLADSSTWWKSTLIFGIIWAFWHVPLFLIPGTYQYNILHESPWFMVNFFAGILPVVFLLTWVYVKNNRSILACAFFHLFVNFIQEQIAMTQVTKCVETAVMYVAAAIIIVLNKDMFFEEEHIGRLRDLA